MLHRFSQMLAGCTIVLILAGSLVTSNGAGLSVPDWPTSYGWNIFSSSVVDVSLASGRNRNAHRVSAEALGFQREACYRFEFLRRQPQVRSIGPVGHLVNAAG